MECLSLEDLGKGKMIADVCKNCRANIICLEKTKLNTPSPVVLRTLAGGGNREWIYKNRE